MRFDIICRSDIIRWRDDCAEEAGEVQPRASGLAAMLKYAEALGYLRKGSNPCRGTPRFKRKAMERFSARRSIGGLGWRWTKPKKCNLCASRSSVCCSTLARGREIGGLQWDWVKLLPDSKTGPKTIWLCSQAVQILESVPRREGCPFVFPNLKGDAPLKLDVWWPNSPPLRPAGSAHSRFAA
jgi:hypothetical protein